jgi:GH24 family phage-related lysozyme (muramidase)
MPLAADIKSELRNRLYQYEGKFNHLYLDTRGKVTVGVGHLIPNRAAIATVSLYKIKNNLPSQPATLQEKQNEYDKIVKLPWGQRYGAISFKPHTSLVMKDTDIDLLLYKHIDSFYRELTNIYKKANGYPDDFDKLHKNVQLALFDMIFNLGASKIVNSFPKFNTALKAGDWKKATAEANRPDVSPSRNQYVQQLLQTVPVSPTHSSR